jgi:hypothetical protein
MNEDNNNKTIIIDYSSNFDETLKKKFSLWKSVVTRKDVDLFTFEDYSNVLQFKNDILENELSEYKTLRYIKKDNESIDTNNFILKNVVIRFNKLLGKYYKLVHLLIKNNQNNIIRFIPKTNEENENIIEFKNLNIKLFNPIEESFIFGIQYKYNDSCGVVMTEMFQNPENEKIIQLELNGVQIYLEMPFIQLASNTIIKINYFKKKIFFYNYDDGQIIGELAFDRMKRNSFKNDCNNTVYSFDISQGIFQNISLLNNVIDNVFNEILFRGGKLELLNRCCCQCNCNCEKYTITFSKLELDDTQFLKKYGNYKFIKLKLE